MWLAAICIDLALLCLAPPAPGVIATFLLGAAWCKRIDREEYAVQVIDSDGTVLNR